MKRILFLLSLFLLFPAAHAFAQMADGKAGTAGAPRLEELRAKGSEALFNLDYDGARQTFNEMARLFPDDPNFHDAELTIGVYDYVVGTLPLAAKLVASIAGTHGSKKRGLATLERVAQEGHWERDDARVMLIALYKREKHFAESLKLSREL